MPFDLELASASMGPWFNDMWALRDRYPELAFIFDELEELRDNAEEAEEGHAAEMRELESEKNRIETWVSDARDELRRACDEIEVTVDEDDADVLSEYTVDALMTDLRCTRDQINDALRYLEGIGQ